MLLAIGLLTFLVGYVMVLVAAFREHVGWGVACLLLPVVVVIAFAIRHWMQARNGFGTMLCGIALFISGAQ